MWSLWWVWVVAGFAIGILEIVVPGYVFLGFAIGAILTGGAVATGLFSANLPVLLLIFAAASLVAWLGLKLVFGFKSSTSKQWTNDINDN